MKKNRHHTRTYNLFTDIASPYSEAFQQLQVNLNYSFIGEKDKVVIITSSLPKEGKSTVSANLAYIYGKKNYKVLLIDLDLRKPCLHHFFKLINDKGVTDFCSGDATKEQIIQHVENIDLITAGSHTMFPGKVLESDILLTLINELKKEYDYIILDTPPVMVASDAIICSRFTSQYLLVTSYAKTTKNNFEDTVRQLKADTKINIIGVVMNNYKFTKDEYDYKYLYNYGDDKR